VLVGQPIVRSYPWQRTQINEPARCAASGVGLYRTGARPTL